MNPKVPHYARALPFRLGPEPPADPLANALRALDEAHTAAGLERALDALRRVAGSGSAPAALILGRLLLAIEGAAAEGAKWLEAAATAGEPRAAHLLGLVCAGGLPGVAQDLARARRLQQQAAELGLADAQLELSLLLARGLGGKANARAARAWEAKAADAGQPRACLNRGARAARARRPDHADAARWYERAAAAGNAEAAARLCKMFLVGQGVARDETAARIWFERAAALGHDWSSEEP